ncbi:condensation domain-containing protein [Streptomyces sp. C8S0]|uniref:condensation domain-containing protein n=1 Tax=Streptomyces sp. C8S0 TaxID=2585716 RepID=UPI00125D0709
MAAHASARRKPRTVSPDVRSRTGEARWQGCPTSWPCPSTGHAPWTAGTRGGPPARLDAGLQVAITELAHKHGATPFMVFQTGLAMVLHELGAGADIPLGTVVAGRADPALDDLVGFFANTVVLRTDLSGDPSFTELLARVRGTTLDMYAHQELPFEQVVAAVNPPRSLSRHPLFQVMLVLQNVTGYEFEMAGLDVSVVEEATSTAKFDLLISLTEKYDERRRPLGVTGYLEYDTALFDPSTARRIGDRLAELLATVVVAPGHRTFDAEDVTAV